MGGDEKTSRTLNIRYRRRLPAMAPANSYYFIVLTDFVVDKQDTFRQP